MLNFGSTSVSGQQTKFAGCQLRSPDLFSGVNVNNPSKYNLCLTACSPFDFNSGFLPIYQKLAKSSFTQFSTIHRVGHFMGKILERRIFGIGHLQHQIPEGGCQHQIPYQASG